MPLVIDGHNLIPKISGLHLRDLDDEAKLIDLIQQYCRRQRTSAELFFDGSLPGTAQKANAGLVHVHYIRKGGTADQAIVDFFENHAKTASNFILVTSDHAVQNQVRHLGPQVLTSEQFAREVISVLSQPEVSTAKREKPLSESEVDEWLEFFRKGKKNS